MQEAKLRAAWDDQGGAPGATAAIAAELGWRKGAVGRHLKALGLKRGVLTAVQVSGRFTQLPVCLIDFGTPSTEIDALHMMGCTVSQLEHRAGCAGLAARMPSTGPANPGASLTALGGAAQAGGIAMSPA